MNGKKSGMYIFGYPKYIDVSRRQTRRAFLDFEVNLSRAVAQNDPQNLEALSVLGAALTRSKKHGEALEVDKALVSRLPQDSTAWYNLACSYSNLEKVDEALKALRKAIRLGYTDLTHMTKDRDLRNVRRDPRFQDIVLDILRARQPKCRRLPPPKKK